MAPERPPRPRPTRWNRLGPTEKVVTVALAAIAFVGLVLIADGLYLKTRALASQFLMDRGVVLKLSGGAPAGPLLVFRARTGVTG
ncbi:hypothetical protein M8R20_08520 [Pseudomonas sp. R2.Fl]|nr:hypothetical protein [Pseudomonas sp. R2.Fl]